jgi:SAM-dependent methyltransferase
VFRKVLDEVVMTRSYALGDGPDELSRLARQARLIDPITTRFFTEAGIVPGMRVLDVGSGAGDVAILLARLVGDGGHVVGTDISASALAAARARVAALRLDQVTFLAGDPAGMAFDRPFDAVVGRYVLQFLPDPAATLKRLAGHLKTGGIVAFHELDWQGARSFPIVPDYDRCCDWCARTIRALGAQTSMGLALASAFRGAGLSSPRLILEASIAAGADAREVVHLVTDLVATLAPDILRFGLATEADLSVVADPARLMAEVAQCDAVLIGRAEIGCWTRL